MVSGPCISPIEITEIMALQEIASLTEIAHKNWMV